MGQRGHEGPGGTKRSLEHRLENKACQWIMDIQVLLIDHDILLPCLEISSCFLKMVKTILQRNLLQEYKMFNYSISIIERPGM